MYAMLKIKLLATLLALSTCLKAAEGRELNATLQGCVHPNSTAGSPSVLWAVGPKESIVDHNVYHLFRDANEDFCSEMNISRPDFFERVAATASYLDLRNQNLTGTIPGPELVAVCERLGHAWDGPMAEFAPTFDYPNIRMHFGLLDLRNNSFTGAAPKDLVACCQGHVLQEVKNTPRFRCLGIGSAETIRVSQSQEGVSRIMPSLVIIVSHHISPRLSIPLCPRPPSVPLMSRIAIALRLRTRFHVPFPSTAVLNVLSSSS